MIVVFIGFGLYSYKIGTLSRNLAKEFENSENEDKKSDFEKDVETERSENVIKDDSSGEITKEVSQVSILDSAIILRSPDNDGTIVAIAPVPGTTEVLEGRLSHTINEVEDMENTYFAVRIAIWVSSDIMKQSFYYKDISFFEYEKDNPEDSKANEAYSVWLESSDALEIINAIEKEEQNLLIEKGVYVVSCSDRGIDVLMTKKQIESILPSEKCGYGITWTPVME